MCDEEALPQEPIAISDFASPDDFAINTARYSAPLPLEQFTAGSASGQPYFRFSEPTAGQTRRREPREQTISVAADLGALDPKPEEEAASERLRLEALSRYQAYGALRGAGFDDIARLAAFICKTPMSLISLVDSTRQWFLSSAGIDACETSREVSFCAQALIGPDMLIVPDACADARFADNPYVTAAPQIRFFAGAPLMTPDGYTLGTLCIIDRVPRNLSREQKSALASLRWLSASQLEMQRLKISLPNRQ